jgi:hypothetical protein
VDEILIVDDHSTDKTVRIAKQYGARVVHAVAGVDRGAYTVDCKHDWIFCVLPNETPSEALEASIFEWKDLENIEAAGMLVYVRVQKGEGWHTNGRQMRLADRNKVNWPDLFPSPVSNTEELSGDLLRFDD